MPLYTVPLPVALGVVAHAADPHLLVDTVQGVLIGVTLVVLYLGILRWIDRSRPEDGSDTSPATRSTEQRRQDS